MQSPPRIKQRGRQVKNAVGLIFRMGLDYDPRVMDRPAAEAIRIPALFGAVLLAAACTGTGPSSLRRQLDAEVARIAAPDRPGLGVLVVQRGAIVYERAVGVADLRTRRPLDSGTNFRLASVSKPFTAAAVVLLVRDGKLAYDDPLTAVYPDFPAYGRRITIRHLLNHTSGLPDYEDLMPPADPAEPVEKVQISDEGVLELLKAQASGKFEPGSRWDYSNSGYVVLGLIVARVSGRTFPEFLRERLFGPLGMSGTVAHEPGQNDIRCRAYGHSLEGGRWLETDQSPTSATLGDGGVYSSLDDLLKWDDALRRRTLLGEAEMRTVLTPAPVTAGLRRDPDGTPDGYGFGWYLGAWRGRARMWHTGETMGFRTAIMRFIDDGLTVIVLGNRSDLDTRALAEKAAGLWLGARP